MLEYRRIMKKVNPKSDAQPNLPEVLQNTSSSEFSDVSERSTEELDDKSFPTNIQSQVQNSPDGSIHFLLQFN